MNINTQTIARQTVCPGRLQFPIFIYIFFLSLKKSFLLRCVRSNARLSSWKAVFPFAFSASTFFFFLFWPCGQKRPNYLTRMRRGSSNKETPKGVLSSKNNRQLVTCRPFRDSYMRTKPNSYRHGVYRLGSVYRPGSKTLFHAYVVLPAGRHTTPCCGYLCLDTSVFVSTRAMFWILFQLFCWQNFIEVKCKEYNSTQWVCCRVDELCLSLLKGVDYQTTIAKVIQFTFWNHFACLSSSSCTLRCCS